MRVIFCLIITILIVGLATAQKTTYEEEFETQFQVKHLEKGDEASYPKVGNKVTVHYTGTFPDTGAKFDSSKDRNSPFTFTLGQGQVIQCWDQVVARMSRGERIYVICPYKLAYGERGAGGSIPPKTDIAFEIEMISWTGSDDL